MNLVDSFYELVDMGRSGRNSSLPIGLPKLETYIEGFSQNNSYLIAAASGGGKSSFTLYSFIYKPIMEDDASKDVHYLFYNLEMSEEQLLAKLLSIYIYETYGEIITFKDIFSRGRNYRLDDTKYELIKECRPILEKFQDRITFCSGTLNASKYDIQTNKWLKNFGKFENNTYIPNNPNQILGIIIDHISLIRASNGRSKKEEMDLISAHSVSFRNICKIVSPIHIMQLNRNSYSDERRKANLTEYDASDLKDSGSILEDSTIALILYSPLKMKLSKHRDYDIKELQDNYRSIICIKNRFGISDISDAVGYYGNVGIFKELPKPEQISDYSKYKYPDWCFEETEDKTTKTVTLTL